MASRSEPPALESATLHDQLHDSHAALAAGNSQVPRAANCLLAKQDGARKTGGGRVTFAPCDRSAGLHDLGLKEASPHAASPRAALQGKDIAIVIDITPAQVGQDSVGCAQPADTASAVAPLQARVLIFALLCQGVQMFMSYDGGATPASLDTIQDEMDNAWSPAEFGLLGAMDKIGMTATSMLWGRSLQLCNTKLLLVFGLTLNTLCTAIFGSLRSKGPMYAAKFLMGATQSLQGVWATVWTVSMAPPGQKTMWIGMGALSAGIGNGIGTAAAGFGTANGLPYAFAFQLQAACLALLGLFLLVTPSARLSYVERPPQPEPSESQRTAGPYKGEDSPSSAPGTAGSPRTVDSSPSAFEQLQEAWRNKVFCWTGLAISVAMFEMSGIQFLWVRLFTEVWGLDKSLVTLMFLVVTGVGGAVGLAVGPRYIDKSGGFQAPPGVVASLTAVQYFTLVGCAAGLLGMVSMYGKLRSVDRGYLPKEIGGDHWLWLMIVAISLIWAVTNAAVPALCGINVEVVPNQSRSFYSGTEMTLRNILGYAAGPLLPGVIMGVFEQAFGWEADRASGSQWTLCVGFGFVLLGTFVSAWVLRRATVAAQGALSDQRHAAMKDLREALRAEEIDGLERAVAFARSVRLNEQRDGEAVLGMANEAIGAYHAIGRAIAQGSIAFFASPSELSRKILSLEMEVARLREENGELRRPPQEHGELRVGPAAPGGVAEAPGVAKEPPAVAEDYQGSAQLCPGPWLGPCEGAASSRGELAL